MTSEMNLADEIERKRFEISTSVRAMIARRNEHIADVEQKSTAGRARDLLQELGLWNRRFLEAHIGCWVFQEKKAPERGLVDMIDRGQGRLCIGQRKEVVEKRFSGARTTPDARKSIPADSGRKAPSYGQGARDRAAPLNRC